MKLHPRLFATTILLVACGEVKTEEKTVAKSSHNPSRSASSDAVAVSSISGSRANAATGQENALVPEEENASECMIGGTCETGKVEKKATPAPAKCALGGC